jgi:hypothetical protein
LHRYAIHFYRRLQLTRIDDGEIVDIELKDIFERRKEDGHEDVIPWSEKIRVDHIQALLVSAKGKIESLEDLEELKKFEELGKTWTWVFD